MNDTLIYLLKVSAAIALVTLPYYLALRNDANLVVKRIYLVTGILLSWTFPLLSVRKPAIITSMDPVFLIDPGQPEALSAGTAGITSQPGISPMMILAVLYMAGILAFILLNLVALARVRKKASKPSGKKNVFLTNSEKVFTIYPNIFLPEKYAATADNDAILIHERAHIRQLHMADLLISELSLALTWFNPFSWLISRMIKENHEHLADREVLSQGVRPAHYKSLLLNHALGGEVFRLGHQFNHSLTKKRFNMMKKMKAKKRGLLKYILFVPAILFFTLMVTAAGQKPKTIEGRVYLETTEVPATGASIIIAGTPMGTVADKSGAFALEVTGSPDIMISFVGYETARLSAKEVARKPVILIPTSYEIDPGEKERIHTHSHDDNLKIIEEEIIMDGSNKKIKVKIRTDEATNEENSDEEVLEIETRIIREVEKEINDSEKKALKEAAKEGEKIEKEIEVEVIKSGKGGNAEEEEVFYIVEEIPAFPGGRTALGSYIDQHLDYPAEAGREKMSGKVMVEFKVQTDGSLDDIRVAQSSNNIFNSAALAVFEDMPAWKPGKQRGKAVSCKVIVPVRFIPDAE